MLARIERAILGAGMWLAVWLIARRLRRRLRD